MIFARLSTTIHLSSSQLIAIGSFIDQGGAFKRSLQMRKVD